jgi:hypothetical protein
MFGILSMCIVHSKFENLNCLSVNIKIIYGCEGNAGLYSDFKTVKNIKTKHQQTRDGNLEIKRENKNSKFMGCIAPVV